MAPRARHRLPRPGLRGGGSGRDPLVWGLDRRSRPPPPPQTPSRVAAGRLDCSGPGAPYCPQARAPSGRAPGILPGAEEPLRPRQGRGDDPFPPLSPVKKARWCATPPPFPPATPPHLKRSPDDVHLVVLPDRHGAHLRSGGREGSALRQGGADGRRLNRVWGAEAPTAPPGGLEPVRPASSTRPSRWPAGAHPVFGPQLGRQARAHERAAHGRRRGEVVLPLRAPRRRHILRELHDPPRVIKPVATEARSKRADVTKGTRVVDFFYTVE